MNEDIFAGQWKQMRGELKSWWGRLADDDLEQIGGHKDQLDRFSAGEVRVRPRACRARGGAAFQRIRRPIERSGRQCDGEGPGTWRNGGDQGE